MTLRLWADVAGAWLSADEFPPLVKGGREHHIYDPWEAATRITKVTVGPEFGYYPCCFPNRMWRDACHWFSTDISTPRQYFRRLRLLNELFPRCETRLEGFVSRGDVLHAVTSQLIAKGRPAAGNEIEPWLTGEGFVFVNAWTWFRPHDGVALFDVMEKNVMRCDDGAMVPFDVIPIRCEGRFLEMMHLAAQRMVK